MPTVLLTGANGFLGQHLLRELRLAGVEVRALSRRPAADGEIAAMGGQPVARPIASRDRARALSSGAVTTNHRL